MESVEVELVGGGPAEWPSDKGPRGESIAPAARVPLDPRKHAAHVQATLRDGGIYIVPATPRLGINARLARDGSAWISVDKGFAETWRRIRNE